VSEIETAVKRWPTATRWVLSYFGGGVVGALAMAWIIANDSHTGVGMGGFFLVVGIMFLAGVAAAIGGVMLIFRPSRERGVILLAGGAGVLTTTFLRMFA
jgi:hypothetical protein